MSKSVRYLFITFLMMAVCFAAAGIAAAEPAYADVTVDNGIPVVYITVEGSKADIDAMNESEDHSVSCSGTVSIDVPEGFHYVDMPDAPCEDLPASKMTIRGRGNSTWSSDIAKKPYKLKLDKKADLFGLGANKHWVLLANALDRTMLKDRITAWLGDEIGMAYTPRGVPVDLVMRSSDGSYEKYLGSYYLSEQVRVGNSRIEIDELTAGDVAYDTITGGYVVQNGIQTDEDSPSYFETESGAVWANHTPNFDPDDDGYVNEAQMDYIRGYMQDLEDAILSADYDGTEGTSYRDLMDIESAAKYWLVDQASKNADGYGTGSTYLYKPRGDKMYWGPLWDYDYAWYYEQEYEEFQIQHEWLSGMFYDTGEGGFVREIKNQWPAVKEALTRIAEDGGIIDQYYEETKASQEADLALYPGKNPYNKKAFNPAENKEKFKAWILNRIAWMDQHLDDLDNVFHKVTVQMDGVETDHIFVYDGYPFYYFLPVPEKEGYTWTGWRLENGKKLKDDYTCRRDLIVEPVFIPDDDATQLKDLIFERSEDYASLSEGYYGLKYTLIPADAQNKRIKWVSSDETVAAIHFNSGDDAEAVLYKTGDVTFTATLRDGTSRSFTLHVVDYERPMPVSLKTDRDKYELNVGEYGHIEVTPEPADAVVSYIWFAPEDYEIVDIDSHGVMRALKPGRTFVTITTSYMDGEEEVTLETTVEVVVAGAEPEQEITYHCIKGDGLTWRKGTGEKAIFTFKRSVHDEETFDHFAGIKIDGKTVPESAYTAVSGSVVITLGPDYLEELDIGTHTLTAEFDDAEAAEASFTIVETDGGGEPAEETDSGEGADKPDTGDTDMHLAWVVFTLSASLMTVILMKRKKQFR